MSAVNDGGQAFPQPFIYEFDKGACGAYTGACDVGFGGMTLRDYFAAKVLPMCAEEFWGGGEDSMKTAAECAYQIADAMLAARAKCPSAPAA